MGDEFIQKKNRNFKHQREKVHEADFKQASVFSNAPEKDVRLFRFKVPSSDPQPGTKIIFADLPGKEGVRVMFGNVVIGEVDAAGSAELRVLMAKSGGTLPGEVVTAKDLAGYCKAKVGA